MGRHDILDKKTTVKFGTSMHRSEGLLHCVHVSVWGPAKTASLGGHRSEALDMLVKWKGRMEKQARRKVDR